LSPKCTQQGEKLFLEGKKKGLRSPKKWWYKEEVMTTFLTGYEPLLLFGGLGNFDEHLRGVWNC